jgi:glycogen debranching enzyme GlgX/4-alpha-glucanotransferase
MSHRYAISSGQATRLGVTIHQDGVNLAVLSRHAERIFVCLFEPGNDREIARLLLPGRAGNDIHHGFIAGVKCGARYGLRAEGPFDPARGHLFDPAKLLVDPYARRLDRPFVWHPDLAAPRGAAIDTAPLVPKAVIEAPLPPAAPLSSAPAGFIYEIAIKAFTARHPGVPASLRGTAAALAHPQVIEHLVTLGVDTVELMPVAAWIDERHLPAFKLRNSWGYNPVVLMAPDPKLAPGGLSEIRLAVDALHQAGIRVLLDVVANHTGEGDRDGPTLSLRGLDNALYYRHAEEGRLVNDTGCGNTLAVERGPVVRLVMDALRHWVEATGVDGFRFDLAAVFGRTPHGFDPDAALLAAINQDPGLAGLTLVAEPWDLGPGGYRLGHFPNAWHEWNDRYRDDVRSFWRSDHAGSAASLAMRVAGSSDVFGSARRPPSRSLNYVAAHDGLTLRDVVSYRTKHNLPNGEDNRDGSDHEISWNRGVEGPTADAGIEACRRGDVRAMLATLMVSRGTPMLTAGDELGRTQDGNNNAYAQDNSTTWLDWEHTDDALCRFVAQLARLRRLHRALSLDAFLTGRAVDETGIPDARWLLRDGQDMARPDWADPTVSLLGLALYVAPTETVRSNRVVIWFNRASEDVTAAMPVPQPGCTWRVACCSLRARADLDQELDSHQLIVPGRSVVVVAERPDTHYPRGRMADDALIGRLGAAAGIKEEWWALDGTHHRVTPEIMRALLRAMRLPAATAAEACATLETIRRERDARILPWVRTLAAGVPGTMRLAVPERLAECTLALDLRLEGGGEQRLEFAPGELHEAERLTIDGEQLRHLAIPLPALPPGCHDAALADTPDQRCRLIVAPQACFLDDSLADGARQFGLTSHLYAVRHQGDDGIGDFETLSRFCETTAALRGAVVGINPLHHLFPTDRGRASPYQPSDRRFIDPIYIDLLGLVAALPFPRTQAALRQEEATISRLRGLSYVDYQSVWRVKRSVLAAAFTDFEESRQSSGSGLRRQEFEDFVRNAGQALTAHAVFEVLAERFGGVDPARWPTTWRSPASGEVAAFAVANAGEVAFRTWMQWIADRQLAAAAGRARQAGLGLGLYRDLALGTAPDGGEVWASPRVFAAEVSLGAPPDQFARDGQVWQLAPFDPHALVRSAYAPFTTILAVNMRHAGMLRIDHILGFTRQFWVPQGATGRDGAYVEFPLETLIAITAIESRRAKCTIVGEDLGTVPEGLRQRLAAAGILSCRVLWFEKDGADFCRPERYPALSVSSLSSHDLPTFVGWTQGRDIEIDRQTGRLDARGAEARIAERGREAQHLRDALRSAGLQSGDSVLDLMVDAHAFTARTPSALMTVQVDDLWEETEPLNLPGTDRERANWCRRQHGAIEDLPVRDVARRVLAAVERERKNEASGRS